MRDFFVTWYYLEGVKAAFLLWVNLMRAWWLKGNIPDLFLTLFAPWHRDVSARDWVGFHPMLALERMLMNVMSRFIGGVVRLIVILLVLGATVIFFFGGIFGLLSFVLAPIVGLLTIALFLSESSFIIAPFVSVVVGLSLAFYIYLQREKDVDISEGLLGFQSSRIFEAVAKRLGCSSSELASLRIMNEESFLDRKSVV